jgi:hypothetical protein
MESSITVNNETNEDNKIITTFIIKKDDLECQIILGPYPYVMYLPLIELQNAMMENKRCKVNYGKGAFISTKEDRTTIATNECTITMNNKCVIHCINEIIQSIIK